jgi:hypothetical protein
VATSNANPAGNPIPEARPALISARTYSAPRGSRGGDPWGFAGATSRSTSPDTTVEGIGEAFHNLAACAQLPGIEGVNRRGVSDRLRGTKACSSEGLPKLRFSAPFSSGKPSREKPPRRLDEAVKGRPSGPPRTFWTVCRRFRGPVGEGLPGCRGRRLP